MKIFKIQYFCAIIKRLGCTSNQVQKYGRIWLLVSAWKSFLQWKGSYWMEDIQKLVTDFRRAIDAANANGEFDKDFSFNRFPRGCCGDASDLLGEYLLEKDIQSIYVCGNRYFDDPEEGTQSHAWLLVDDMIADITGDQFSDRLIYYNYDIPGYYGPMDDFHRLFDVEDRDVRKTVHLVELGGFCYPRLKDLYGKINKYL